MAETSEYPYIVITGNIRSTSIMVKPYKLNPQDTVICVEQGDLYASVIMSRGRLDTLIKWLQNRRDDLEDSD